MIGQPTKGNIDLVRQLNMATIYKTIAIDGPVSRTRIGEVTRIAGASVSKITKQLLRAGLIKEGRQARSTGGRRAVLLSAVMHGYFAISLKLGRGYLKAALHNLAGDVLSETQRNVTVLKEPAVLDIAFKEIGTIIAGTGIDVHKILGIGLIMPGLVNPGTGMLIETPFFHIRESQIAKKFEDRFKIPTFLDNDVKSQALAEHYFGASRDKPDSVLISVKHGIGAGIVVEGNIFYGSHHNAGEIGHMFIDHLGPRCNCGNFGCLETLASNPGILRYTEKLIKHGHPSVLAAAVAEGGGRLTVKQICQAARQGDELSQAVLSRTGRYLGIAIATVINLFNPNMIILSGDIVEAPDFIFPSIEKQVAQKSLDNFAAKTQIVPSQLNNDNETIGAFALIQRALFQGQLFSRIVNNH